MTWNEMTHPDDLDKDFDYYNQFIQGKIEYANWEKRFFHKNGSLIIVHIEVNRINKANGKIEAFLVAIEDITERKHAEVALRDSEQRLSLVFKGTNDGWWDLDLISNIAYHSPRWWSMLGYGPDQDTIDPTLWQRITHPDDIEPTLKLIRQALASEQNSYEVELRLQHQDGHYVPILTRAFILRDEQGRPLRISGANMDLSERKAAEEALRRQEEFNRVLLENQTDGVIACDANMNLAVFNHVARDWHGLDAMNIPPEQWDKYFTLYDAEGEHQLKAEQIPLLRAFNGEYLVDEAIAIKIKGQPTRFISCSAAPFYDNTGKKLGAVAIMRDITESLQQSEVLRQSEALYREMFDANPHSMWVFDTETLAFLAVNDAAIRHYGWSREEFLSMTIADIRPPEDVDKLKKFLPYMINNNLNNSGEWRHQKKDGSLIDVEITSHPLNFNGHAARVVLSYDLTERNNNAQEIQTLNRLLLTLSNINQTIVRRLDPVALFQEACTIAIRDGKLRMAWIGLVQPDGKTVKPVASAGEIGDYIDDLIIDLQDKSLDIPSVRAIRTGQHFVSNDISRDESFVPWRKAVVANGYEAMVSLPLKLDGKTIGNFSLYSGEKNVFNAREVELLVEMAGDISFALEVSQAEKQRQEAAKALRESEVLFHTLASASPVGILHTDLNGKPLYANARCFELSGLTVGQMNPEDWARATHPEDRKHVKSEWTKAVRARRGFIMEYRFLRPDNSVVWVQGQAEPERGLDGELLGFVGTITDITALKNSEENLRMSAAVFENTREGIMVTNAENRILIVNRAFTEITRFKAEDVIGTEPGMLGSGRHDRDFYNLMWQSLKEIGHWQGEIWNRRKNGDIHPVLMSISVIKNNAGEIVNYVAVFADISNLKASEAQLEFLAHHDPLTRLPNRLMLISRLGHAIEVARRDKSQLALLMLDLDRFKNVNDSFGHLAGDELLQLVAKRLTERLRGVDTVTRLGGDEFTVLLEDIAQPEDAARVADSIIAALEIPWKLSNNIEVRIGASVGISLYPGHGTGALELLQHADAALYQAKAAGRGCARYFSESLTQAARYRFNIEARLRQAVPNDELRVYYQPKIDIRSRRIVGVEALVRWQDPVDGLIQPLRFIGIAEETGLIGLIGEWVMREACYQGRRWLDNGQQPVSIAVNMSAHQLHHSDIVSTLSAILAETRFPAEYLELELTESILMQREDEVVETLNRVRAKGIRLAIDDFGTGYSSLSYLKSFPLDVLKIDRSFVTDIEDDLDDRAITATIIGIAHTLGLQVVAEGVETEQQLEFLRNHKCDMYQGYLTSPALSAEEFEQFLKAYKPG
jgi:diguanylate cyclase (GGDEF)-like protein/PAS domain S-box-containing protein